MIRRRMKDFLLTALFAIATLACCLCGCGAPHRETEATTQAAADSASASPSPATGTTSAEQKGIIAVGVTAGPAAVNNVQFAILAEDEQVGGLFLAGSDKPAEPRLLSIGRHTILAGRRYGVTPDISWDFSAVKSATLTKPGERVVVEFAVPRQETVSLRIDPPQGSGVGPDFFEYVEIELDQPGENSIFTEFQGDTFELRGRVPVGKAVPLPVLPPGEYAVYVEYAARRSLWTRTGDGPEDWLIPSVASRGETISFPAETDTIVVRPTLSQEDQEAIQRWSGQAR